ncbi:D-alanyl-D-alanine carboxypeptidase [Paenibacillus lycopersici]|uniref:D-alanyl-D-alanine carboxypeptidase n=1 Tax=Paenibacillus lycopersici TaxID=2704462 RepID=A0A6C0G6R6_9BACL|nr:D-alanyl-D-alanine carboxypeptidase family protein [Paenibacillus lycopersici]QHT61565.1 D-alanyl-D-alanine carboxypeptidase [Paenibacillus lycopersici]
MSVYKPVRLAALLLILFVLGSAARAFAAEEDPGPPALSSDSAILIDAKTGTVLLAHNEEKEQFPASITKIVTGIIAIESGRELSSLVTTSKEARNEDGTRIYLEEGEQQTLINLLYGMLMNSGNDAATAIAEFMDGSKAKFADRMNEFVREKAGATHTFFVNPSGLPDPRQVTTAVDMAKIARYAMQNDLFRTIVGTKKLPWNGQAWQTTLVNHNEMLGNYEGTTGVKNGYTGDSGFTLVTSAKRNGMELIGVLLKSPTKALLYKDMTHLLDYGFRNYDLQQVKMTEQAYPFASLETEGFVAEEPLYAVVPKGETPVVTVSPAGEVNVRTSLGDYSAGWLKPVSPNLSAVAQRYPEVETAMKSAASPVHDAIEPSNSKKEAILFVWIGLLVYLGVMAVIRLKRQRVQRRRY